MSCVVQKPAFFVDPRIQIPLFMRSLWYLQLLPKIMTKKTRYKLLQTRIASCLEWFAAVQNTRQTNKLLLTWTGIIRVLLQIADPKIVVVHNASGKRGQAVAEGHNACAQAGMCRERNLSCRGGLCRALMVLILVYACVFFMVSNDHSTNLAYFVITVQISWCSSE